MQNNNRIVISGDHGGYDLMKKLCAFFDKNNIPYTYMGPSELNPDDNYPELVAPACLAVANNSASFGILICGSGVGVSMVANRYKGVRAVLCKDVKTAEMSRHHNNANVLCMGGRVVSYHKAVKIVKHFLTTKFDGGRHIKRLAMFN